ncbi:MAG: pilus assembly protein [Actinomycetota bacterium]|nr:pilus assembly protein [Actinomycetota bacterium]
MVEFALVILPLMLLLYGLVSFGMMLALKQSMTNAAAEAARAAVGATDPVATAQATVQQRLSWLGSKYQPSDSPTPVVAPCINDTAKNCITVQIIYPYGSRPLIPPAPGLGLVTPNAFTSQATVQIS